MRRVPRDMSALSLAYHLMVRFRRAPKNMSVVRFSLAKAGQPLVARFRRALRGITVLRSKRHVHFMLSKSQGGRLLLTQVLA